MSIVFNAIKYCPEFEKDLKLLSKRFRTLGEDIRVFVEKQLNLYHKLHVDNKGIFHIADLEVEYPNIYKARKFACRSLKGKGAMHGIRIIYAYYEDTDTIEFIEIYYKGDKNNENRDRITRIYGNIAPNAS